MWRDVVSVWRASARCDSAFALKSSKVFTVSPLVTLAHCHSKPVLSIPSVSSRFAECGKSPCFPEESRGTTSGTSDVHRQKGRRVQPAHSVVLAVRRVEDTLDETTGSPPLSGRPGARRLILWPSMGLPFSLVNRQLEPCAPCGQNVRAVWTIGCRTIC